MARFEKSRCWIAAALLIVATTLFLSCNSGSKTARGEGATGANEEYDIVQVGENQDALRLKGVLNDDGKQGWKVRAILPRAQNGSIIILAR